MAGFADIAPYLAQKYAILQQQADTSELGTRAAANLDTVKAGLLPGQTAADIAQTRSQAGLIDQQAKYFGPTADAQIGLYGAQAQNYRADAGLATANATGVSQINNEVLGFSPEQLQRIRLNRLGLAAPLGTLEPAAPARRPSLLEEPNYSDAYRRPGLY